MLKLCNLNPNVFEIHFQCQNRSQRERFRGDKIHFQCQNQSVNDLGVRLFKSKGKRILQKLKPRVAWVLKIQNRRNVSQSYKTHIT